MITLTIIGVVAALIIPQLMQNYRRQTIIIQIHAAQSILENAVTKAIALNGPLPSYNDSNDHTFETVVPYILPQLNVVKKCKMRTFWEYGCKYGCDFGCFGSKDKSTNGIIYTSSGQEIKSMPWFYTLKLSNGMDVAIKNVGDYIYILVDVNGAKGPTQLGLDVHGFTYRISKRKWLTGANYVLAIYPNLPKKTIYAWKYCPDEDGNGSCTRVLELSGWDVPDDYPIKKF